MPQVYIKYVSNHPKGPNYLENCNEKIQFISDGAIHPKFLW